MYRLHEHLRDCHSGLVYVHVELHGPERYGGLPAPRDRVIAHVAEESFGTRGRIPADTFR